MKRYTCNCGRMHFKKDGEKIVCNNCGKDVSESEENGFFSTSDSKVKEFFCKLGLDTEIRMIDQCCSMSDN